jgi:hypothetical protein
MADVGAADLIITIDAKADKAKEVLSELIKDQEHLGAGLEAAALAGVAAFAALVAGIGMSVEAFEEHEKAVRSLNLALQNQGMFSEELTKQYQETAKALEEKTGIDEDAILSGQALMQSFIGQREIAPTLTKAIVDMSVATGTDLHGAFSAVSRAVETGTLAFGRLHIQLDPTLDKSERLAKVTEILGQKFDGAAEEAVAGLGGWALVKVQFTELEKQVGEDFAPAFVTAIDLVKKTLGFLGPIVKGAADVWNEVFPTMWNLFNSFVYMTIQAAGGLGKVLYGAFHFDLKTIKEGWAEVTNVIDDGLDVFEKDQDKSRASEIKKIQVQNQKKKELADQQNQEDQARDRLRAEAEELKNQVAVLEITEQGSKILELKKRQLSDLEKAAKTHDKATAAALKADAAAQVKEAQTLGKTLLDVDKAFHTQKIQQLQQGLSEAASMQQSHNSTLKAIGKAAAIADIIINTESSVVKIISGFSAIPFIGYELGLAVAGAMIAYSGERIANVVAANKGGIILPPGVGSLLGQDTVPAMLTPGELVVPKQNFEEVVGAVKGARSGDSEGSGPTQIELAFKGDAIHMIEAKIIQRQRLRTSLIR